MPKKIQLYRLKINGKDYDNIDTKKKSKIRWFFNKAGKMEKTKEKYWSNEANQIWDKLSKSGILEKIEKERKGMHNIVFNESKSSKESEVELEVEPEVEPEAELEVEPEAEAEKQQFDEKKDNSDEDSEDDDSEEESEEESKKEYINLSINTTSNNQKCKKLIDELKILGNKLTLEEDKLQSAYKCIENENIKELVNFDKHNLYPHLNDENFTEKISKKKEFNDVKIEKKTMEQVKNLEKESTRLCDTNIVDFELESHQKFVRNFLSFQTPYNGLLLFHGLGTGKTCSSISVCEDMRSYYKQLGINKKILIIASPIVQQNYRLQLFDKRKLKKVNGIWDIKSCTGNKFIKEIDPTNFKQLDENKIIKHIEKIINHSYEFMGYTGFANKIDKLIKKSVGSTSDPNNQLKRKIYIIKKEFSDRMLVIDEVHNVRSKSTKIKRTTQNMLDLVTHAENMKLMLLTATPMFNDYKEIIWLVNLLNLNDNRFPIKISDGNFVENGKELLIRKITGYISYVAGENPFTFPHKIWPYTYNNPHSIKKLFDDGWSYPNKQINGLTVEKPINYLDIIITKLHEEQNKAYDYIVKKAKEKNPILNEEKPGIQYTVIDGPQQGLNMIYPNIDLEKEEIASSGLYGKSGLNRTMYYDKNKTLDLFLVFYIYLQVGF